VPEIVLASQNAGKVAEMRELLAGLVWSVLGLRELGVGDSPEETGESFAENAALKARHYARVTGRLVVADDSGLAVDALGGRPGLNTARYGGPGLDDAGRNRLLLEQLSGVPEARRGARFHCALAVARPGERDLLFEAHETCEGRIATASAGDQGFGYDPIFFYPDFGTTLASVAPERKAEVSHRGKAFRLLRTFLERLPVPSGDASGRERKGERES
jgi:XTP/dITP diphosphohydrolase